MSARILDVEALGDEVTTADGRDIDITCVVSNWTY